MIDQPEINSLIQTMERTAEKVLQRDPAFFETLHALKLEIEENQRVQSAVHGLQRLGQRIFTSFVPRINVRIRNAYGVVGRANASEMTILHPQFQELTEELRIAAAEVIQNSERRRELNGIVSEAISSSEVFEEIASRIEHEGYEIIICLDFSTYTRTLGSDNDKVRRLDRTRPAGFDGWSVLPLSAYDLKLLQTLGIRADL